jgi:hypothetical protein
VTDEIMWLLVGGPVDAEAVRRWLGDLPLDLGDGSLYDAAGAITGGRPVTGRFFPPGGRSMPARFSVDGHGLTVEFEGLTTDDPWWAGLVTATGRALRADTVALVDDPSALIPRLLWVSATARADFADARAHASAVQSEWDGALLMRR